MNARALFLFAAFVWVAGCKTETNPPGIGDDYNGPGSQGTCVDRDGDGYGVGCPLGIDCDDTSAGVTNQCYACQHDQPGCPCTDEGATASCGLVTAHVGNQTTCGYGASICRAGKWSECVLDGKTAQSFTSSRASLGLASPAACTANPCDPYCRQFADTPDDSLTQGNVLGTDGGLTVGHVDGGASPPILPNGPMPERIKAAMTEAGLYPDAQPDAIVYHELPPPSTAQDTLTTPATSKALDLYFLEATSEGVEDEATALQAAASAAGGVVEQVRSAVADTWFGAGHFEQYDQAPYNEVGVATVVYEHVLSMTNDARALDAALGWLTDHVVGGSPAPSSWIDALYASSTTAGLRRGARTPWVAARAGWASRFNGESGACAQGRVGYPCFRPSALSITVLLTNSPAANGPGGQYAYPRDAVHGIDGATLWGAATVVSGNGTEAAAYSIDPTHFATYTGDTSTSGLANQSWTFAPFGDPAGARPSGCDTGWFSASPNVFYKFTVSQRTWFHFDTVGSTFVQQASDDSDYGTALYLYRRSAGGTTTGIACNYAHFFDDPAKPNVSSIDGAVDPGDYFLVVDGVYGSRGNYVLHVNAMADGAATSAPSYDEALSSYKAIGAKFVGVDSSGFTCDSGYGDFVQRNTGNALAKLALDTGSADAAGNPYLVSLNQFGGRCHSGDPPIATQIANAIVGAANARMDVSAVAFDNDDAFDFDGPGGARTLTPIEIDDAGFVQSITTSPSADTTANCLQTLPDRFVGCRAGTKAVFAVTFKTPAAVPILSHEQIFSFVIRTLRDGASILNETPVVIVVPSIGPSFYDDAWFIRDYDTAGTCPVGTAPLWGFFTWNASTPGDSRIDLEVAVAPTIADLPSAPFDALVFADPPGPGAVVGLPIGAQTRTGGPDTQAGGTLVDSTLAINMRQRDGAAMRLRAHLVPSLDRTLRPMLKLWNQQVSCQPAE